MSAEIKENGARQIQYTIIISSDLNEITLPKTINPNEAL